MGDRQGNDITLSVVVYRDYDVPLKMVRSLEASVSPQLDVRLYVVDNSGLEEGSELYWRRESFRQELDAFGFAEYIDAGANLGFGRANNLALVRACSTYHVFVNPDVVFTEDALTPLKAFMDDRPEVGMCIPRVVDAEGELQRVYWRDPSVFDAFNRMFLKNALKGRDRYYTMADADYAKPFRVSFGQGSFLFGRTGLLQELGGFDDRYFMYLEDADLCRRVNERSTFMYCPDATVVHRWERGSHSSLRLLVRHFRSYLYYFRKWGLRLF